MTYASNARTQGTYNDATGIWSVGAISAGASHTLLITATVDGRSLVVRPQHDESVDEFLRPLFEDYYTMAFDNYPVEEHRVGGAEIRDLR